MTTPRLVWTEAAGRLTVRDRSAGQCELCGRARATDWSHRLPRSAGGTWHPANGLAACQPCHTLVHAHRDPVTGAPADVYRLGLFVHRGDNPGSVVARLLHPVYGPGWYDLAAGEDQQGLRMLKPWTPPRAEELMPTRKWTRVIRT